MPLDNLSPRRILWGGVAGLLGGIAFGIMLHTMGMMQTVIASIIRTDSLLLAWTFHLANSFAFGAILGNFVHTRSIGAGLAWGLAWGLVLWIIPGTILLRLILDMPFAIDQGLMTSLVGHLLYGGVTGLAYGWIWSAVSEPRRARTGRPIA